jgi:hypothetical protein
MASIRVDYTIFFEDMSEKKGKMFVPINMDGGKGELIDVVHEAMLDICDDYDNVVSGKASVDYYGVIFDVQFYLEENEECQTTIH